MADRAGSANCAAYREIWLRPSLPSGAGSNEQKPTPPNVTLATIPQGALLGVLRFDGNGSDRRGQTIQAGVYTLRYGIMPANGRHQGAAPQRDFLLLTSAAEDRDGNATPSFDALLAMSRKVFPRSVRLLPKEPRLIPIRKTGRYEKAGRQRHEC